MNKTYIVIGAIALVVIAMMTKKKTPSKSSGKVKDNIKKINEELLSAGILPENVRKGILAVIGKESGFIPKWESTYKNTKNSRIRSIFPTRTGKLKDVELDLLKNNDRMFFDFVYDQVNGNKKNTDGYKYRGSGFNQLTGRGNYEKFGKLAGVNIIDEPELNNLVSVASKTIAQFFKSGLTSPKIEAKIKQLGKTSLSQLNVNDAIRLASNINAGLGRDLFSDLVSSEAMKAGKYLNDVNDAI
jgi:predicted chitinase